MFQNLPSTSLSNILAEQESIAIRNFGQIGPELAENSDPDLNKGPGTPPSLLRVFLMKVGSFCCPAAGRDRRIPGVLTEIRICATKLPTEV